MKVIQYCQTLCHPMDYVVHGILQAKILEWVATSPGDLPNPGIEPKSQVSHMVGGFFANRATREAQEYWSG